MILGMGCDLVDVRRVEGLLKRFPQKARKRLFTHFENEMADGAASSAAFYAKRFAAKEAFAKALGTGIAHGLGWQDVEVSRDLKGKPNLCLSTKAWALLHKKDNNLERQKIQLDLSLSDEYPYAQAFVIISWNGGYV